MKTKIIRVGNSRGIRIPKLLLEESGLAEEIEIQVEKGRLIISPASPGPASPRKGWAKAFKAMAEAGDDELLDGDRALPTRWEKEEWKWE